MPYGPCVICGRVNYGSSYGGPWVCPTCDCGASPEKQFDSYANVGYNKDMETRVSKLEADNKKLLALIDEMIAEMVASNVVTNLLVKEGRLAEKDSGCRSRIG
jgi:hypothetical protein